MKFLKKLKSRKFLAAAAGIAIGAGMIFGLDESDIQAVVGAAVSAVSLVSYIAVEGRVDAAAVEKTVSAIEKASGAVDK